MNSQEPILVVEDEPSVRMLIEEILGMEGYPVQGADGGEQALTMLADPSGVSEQEFALVISDLMMPEVSGLEILAEAKKRIPMAEVILITAYGSVESTLEALRHGAHDYIIKPFNNDDLLHSVKRALAYRRLKLEKADLLTSLQKQGDELKRMLEASNRLTQLSSQPGLLVDEIIEIAEQHLGLTIAVTVLDKNGELFQTRSSPNFQTTWSQVLTNVRLSQAELESLLNDVPRLSRSYLIDPGHETVNTSWLRNNSCQLTTPLLMTPLEARDGHLLGLLWVADITSPLAMDVVQRLEIFANQVSGSLENANLFAIQHRQVHTRNALVEAGHRIATNLDQQEVLHTVLEASLKVMPQADLAIIYYRPGTAETELKTIGMNKVGEIIDSSRLDETLVAQTLKDKQTIYQPSWESDPDAVTGVNQPAGSFIIEPLGLGSVSLGALAMISHRSAAFGDDSHQVLSMLANQAAIALQNARLYTEARRADELEALYETGKAITRTLNLQETLIAIMGMTRGLTGASTSNVYLYTSEHQYIDSVVTLEDNPTISDADHRRSTEIVGEVMESGRPNLILEQSDVIQPVETEDRNHPDAPIIQSRLVVPLATSDSPVGVLELGSEHADTFTPSDVRLVQVIASQAAVAIENARLYEEIQQKLQQNEALGIISRSISNTLDLRRVLKLVVSSAVKTIPVATHSTLYLIDENGENFIPEANYSRQNKAVPTKLKKFREQAIQQVAQKDFVPRRAWQSEQHGSWSLLIAPLMVNEIVIGAISVESPRLGAFQPGDETLLNTFASHASVAIQNANLFRDLSSAYLDLASKQEEILRNNRTLQALFDGITDGLYIVDRDLKIVAINQAEAERLGTTTETIIGQGCDASLWGEATFAVTKIIRDTFEAGEERNWESQIDAAKRGPFTDRDVRTYPIFETSTKVSQVIIFAQDVSEQRRLQASLFRSANLAAVGQLASSIAHQINNPLTVIIANTQLMQMDIDPDSPDYPIITDIVEAGTQIRHIVQNLLDFSTQESYEWFETDVQETIDDALTLVAHSLRKSKIEIEKQIAPLPTIIASANHLKLLWMNLFLNARDAISAGDTTPGKIQILANQANSEHIRIQIVDNGLGIPKQHRKHLFNPFFTTKSSGQHLGLGLYTCRTIVESHNGQIEIDSHQADPGAAVTVTLPIQVDL